MSIGARVSGREKPGGVVSHRARRGRRGRRGSEPALREVEGMNLREAPAFRPRSLDVHSAILGKCFWRFLTI